MDVQIYTTPTCGYCLNAKNWFTDHGIEYSEHSLVNEEEKMEFFQRVNNVEEKIGGARNIVSVPQIFVNGERIGGFTNLLENSEKILKKEAVDFTSSLKPKIILLSLGLEFVTKHEKVHWIEDERILFRRC